MNFSEYLQFLARLEGQFVKLTEVEQKKIQAVQAADLDALNICIRQEQALGLALRGLEQQRESLVQQLGISDNALCQLPERCPPELHQETMKTVESVLRQYQILKSTADSARTLLECELHKVEHRLADKAGLETENLEENTVQIPSEMRTDFRI